VLLKERRASAAHSHRGGHRHRHLLAALEIQGLGFKDETIEIHQVPINYARHELTEKKFNT
jgi:hypothetical protein